MISEQNSWQEDCSVLSEQASELESSSNQQSPKINGVQNLPKSTQQLDPFTDLSHRTPNSDKPTAELDIKQVSMEKECAANITAPNSIKPIKLNRKNFEPDRLHTRKNFVEISKEIEACDYDSEGWEDVPPGLSDIEEKDIAII